MRIKKKQINSLVTYFFTLFYVISLLFLIVTSNSKELVIVSNTNTVKAVESSRVAIKNADVVIDNSEFIQVFSVSEISLNQGRKMEFIGTLTGYGPDCAGCSGIVACSPHLNVSNGNIYYQDATYGTIRILAADRSIPCGSIVKISNYYEEDFYGIVLDRGSAIVGLTMDLLYETENSLGLGRVYNIKFQIERWGY